MNKIYLFRFFIIIHFSIILLSITYLQDKIRVSSVIFEAFFSIYSTITYSAVSYPFFAPEIKEGYEFEFTMKGNGKTFKQFGFPEKNHEAINMLRANKGFFDIDSTTRELYTRSLGVKMLNGYDRAYDTVSIMVYRDSFPTIANYAKGNRLIWKPYYQTTIIAND
jgi:hypothetical protein